MTYCHKDTARASALECGTSLFYVLDNVLLYMIWKHQAEPSPPPPPPIVCTVAPSESDPQHLPEVCPHLINGGGGGIHVYSTILSLIIIIRGGIASVMPTPSSDILFSRDICGLHIKPPACINGSPL